MEGIGGIDDVIDPSHPERLTLPVLFAALLASLALHKHTPNTKTNFRDEYDYIIVGAGTGGSTLAGRLSEVECVDILLLEAGERTPLLTEVPLFAQLFIYSKHSYQYKSVPQRHTAAYNTDRKVQLAMGKAVGGSSITNDMVFIRGDHRDYDDWAKLGAKGWSYRQVLPYFKRLERYLVPEADRGYHGFKGPIPAVKVPYDSAYKRAVMKAARSLRYPFVDPNGRYQGGFYDLAVNQRNGQRYSMLKGYLVPVDHRRNLDIVPEAYVTKILIRNGRAVGVQVDHGGKSRTVYARKEVVVSAGGLRTPHLLMLSGIGPRKHLEKLQIPVQANLPVGKNHQDHCVTGVNYEVGLPMKRVLDRVKDPQTFLEYIISRKGLLASPGSCVTLAFLNNGKFNRTVRPDHELVFFENPIVYGKTTGVSNAPIYDKYMEQFANKSVVGCVSATTHPKSRGRVWLKNSDPYEDPIIDPNYLRHPQDFKDIVGGLKHCSEIFESPTFQRLVGGAKLLKPVFPGCKDFENNRVKHLECLARSLIMSIFHHSGTARMGDPSDPKAVVDPELRVIGIKGLRVVDTSIFPTVPNGNTNIPTVMVAEKASDMIKRSIICTPKQTTKKNLLKDILNLQL